MENIIRETIDVMVHRRAAIYVRVSTGRQEENGTSLETQEERCLEYCKDHKYRTNHKLIYRDVWTGAEYYERPELTRLREDAKKGLFDVVIIYAFDRLARKQVHQAVIIEDLRQHSASVESVTERFDESAVGQFMRNAAAFAAELEHEKIRERTQRGIMSKLRKGQLQGSGRTSYGYSWNEERTGYVINEEEAKIVRLIFDLYVNQGYSAVKICQYLREQGIPNRVQRLKDGRTQLWGRTSVLGILGNPNYIGKGTTHKRIMKGTGGKAKLVGYRPEEERFQIAEGVIPPIIDEETFTRAQEKRAVNKQLSRRNNSHPEVALLRAGYAICGVCGQMLHVHSQSPQPTKGRPYRTFHYRCYETTSTKRCNKICISTDILDAAAWKYIE
jgi:site-specific DNA recombinase